MSSTQPKKQERRRPIPAKRSIGNLRSPRAQKLLPQPSEGNSSLRMYSGNHPLRMNIYAITLAVIVLTLLTVSLTRLGKVKTKADYLVAGRSLPAFVLVFTLLSSWIGSGSLLAGAENAYRHGFAALWQGAGGWAGLLLIYFIAPRARKFPQFTIPDLLEARYNQTP